MNKPILWSAALALGLAALATPLDAGAQVVVTIGPPDAYVASYAPIYYNGFAHYWWHTHWYYRDHGAWHWWTTEPVFLHQHRGEWGNHWHHWR